MISANERLPEIDRVVFIGMTTDAPLCPGVWDGENFFVFNEREFGKINGELRRWIFWAPLLNDTIKGRSILRDIKTCMLDLGIDPNSRNQILGDDEIGDLYKGIREKLSLKRCYSVLFSVMVSLPGSSAEHTFIHIEHNINCILNSMHLERSRVLCTKGVG